MALAIASQTLPGNYEMLHWILYFDTIANNGSLFVTHHEHKMLFQNM